MKIKIITILTATLLLQSSFAIHNIECASFARAFRPSFDDLKSTTTTQSFNLFNKFKANLNINEGIKSHPSLNEVNAKSQINGKRKKKKVANRIEGLIQSIGLKDQDKHVLDVSFGQTITGRENIALSLRSIIDLYEELYSLANSRLVNLVSPIILTVRGFYFFGGSKASGHGVYTISEISKVVQVIIDGNMVAGLDLLHPIMILFLSYTFLESIYFAKALYSELNKRVLKTKIRDLTKLVEILESGRDLPQNYFHYLSFNKKLPENYLVNAFNPTEDDRQLIDLMAKQEAFFESDTGILKVAAKTSKYLLPGPIIEIPKKQYLFYDQLITLENGQFKLAYYIRSSKDPPQFQQTVKEKKKNQGFLTRPSFSTGH